MHHPTVSSILRQPFDSSKITNTLFTTMAPSPPPQASKHRQPQKRAGRTNGGVKIAGTIIPFDDNDVDLSNGPPPTPLFPVRSIPYSPSTSIEISYLDTNTISLHNSDHQNYSRTIPLPPLPSPGPKKPKSHPSLGSAPASTKGPSTPSSITPPESANPQNRPPPPPPPQVSIHSRACQHTAKSTSRPGGGSQN